MAIIETELSEYIQDKLFYHNSYLPKKKKTGGCITGF